MNWEQLQNILARALKPLKDRVLLMIGRAIISAVKEGGPFQQLQVSIFAGESMDKVTRFQEFGFASNPPPGSEGIVLALQGNRENLVVIATENRTVRFKNCAPGEMAIYTDDGTHIHLKKDGQVELKTATLLTVDAPDTLFKGNVTVEGDLEVQGDTSLLGELSVVGVAEFQDDVTMLKNLAVTMVVGAAGYTGPGGGAAVLTVPLNSTAAITTTDNVTGGGTDMATIKSTFNAHTHAENGTGGGVTNAPSTPL